VARYLVVANQTLGGATLLETTRAEAAGRDASFCIVVPASPPRSGFTSTEGQARALADERLRAALSLFRSAGLEVDGEMGDADPMLAVEDVLRQNEFDAIVLSTPASGISQWLGVDLPRRMRAAFAKPVLRAVDVNGSLAA